VETFAEILSAIAAVVLTVACGLLLEELLFRGLVRLFVVPRPGAREKPSPKREEAQEEEQEEKEEHTCLP
jgi:ribosomal protein L12E/L44/L45/RPP1/RPP2